MAGGETATLCAPEFTTYVAASRSVDPRPKAEVVVKKLREQTSAMIDENDRPRRSDHR